MMGMMMRSWPVGTAPIDISGARSHAMLYNKVNVGGLGASCASAVDRIAVRIESGCAKRMMTNCLF